MMKYLKAEAEIIKFDNSDIVTASMGEEVEDNCGSEAVNYVNTYCKWTWLTAFILWLVARGRCVEGINDHQYTAQQGEGGTEQYSAGNGDWM